MKRILVVGRRGQVARALALASWPAGMSVTCRGRDEIDLAEPEAAATAVAAEAPDLVINAAAYTAVDNAEREPSAAYALNCDGPAALAATCVEIGAPLVHLSSDYVFDGLKQGAYVESDPVNPISVYGASKAAGEQAVRSTLATHFILRSAWVYAAQGQNFVRTMLRLAKERSEIGVVNDQRGSPTAASEIARALVEVCGRLLAGSGAFGTFHFCGAGSTTWHGFAEAIFELSGGAAPRLLPIATSAYPTPARRPANSVLDGTKIERLYGVAARPWRESLALCLAEIAAQETTAS
jgi:dTDP-4-dehydrorhamnose reductase